MSDNYQEKMIDNLTILKGILVGVVILIIISFIMALFSSFIYSLSASKLNVILIAENFLIITYVGFYIARRVAKNGWLNGGLGGLIYMGLVILLGTINTPVSILYVFLLLILGLIIGSFGGIIGINF